MSPDALVATLQEISFHPPLSIPEREGFVALTAADGVAVIAASNTGIRTEMDKPESLLTCFDELMIEVILNFYLPLG